MSDKPLTDIDKCRADNALLKRTVELCMAARQELLGRLEARDAEIDRLTESCLRKDDILRIVGATPIGSWLSASLDDPHVCTEMKRDIRAWFAAMSIVDDELSQGEKG